MSASVLRACISSSVSVIVYRLRLLSSSLRRRATAFFIEGILPLARIIVNGIACLLGIRYAEKVNEAEGGINAPTSRTPPTREATCKDRISCPVLWCPNERTITAGIGAICYGWRTMIALVEFSYSSREKMHALSLEDYTALYERFPNIGLPEPGERPKDSWGYGLHEKKVIDLEKDGPFLAELGITYDIKRFRSMRKHVDAGNSFHVHVPNIGLLAINEVQVLDDSCTERLQEKLDKGWRILAICPPLDQRRPDYILGRTKDDET